MIKFGWIWTLRWIEACIFFFCYKVWLYKQHNNNSSLNIDEILGIEKKKPISTCTSGEKNIYVFINIEKKNTSKIRIL